MEYIYLGLASAVFTLHLLFVLVSLPSTALFCAGRFRRRPFLQQAHVISIFIMATGQLMLLECPLVSLERALRGAAGSTLWYDGSFVVFIVERATSFQLPVVVLPILSFLVVTLTAAALIARGAAALLALRSTFRSPSGSAEAIASEDRADHEPKGIVVPQRLFAVASEASPAEGSP